MNRLFRGEDPPRRHWGDIQSLMGFPSNFIAYYELADNPPYIKPIQIENWLSRAYQFCDGYELWGFINYDDECKRFSNAYSWGKPIRFLMDHLNESSSEHEWFAELGMNRITQTYAFGEWEKHFTEVAEYLFKPIMKGMMQECILHYAKIAEKLVAWVVTNVEGFDITKIRERDKMLKKGRLDYSRLKRDTKLGHSRGFVSLVEDEVFLDMHIPRKTTTEEGLRLYFDPDTDENMTVVDDSFYPTNKYPFYIFASFGWVFW